MNRPMKNQRLFDVSDTEPEIPVSFQEFAIPLREIERAIAKAAKKLGNSDVGAVSHGDNSNSSLAGSINQRADEWGMETFSPLKKRDETRADFTERCLDNLSLFFRRKAGQGRGFTGWLADLLECSTSKASKIMYGDANPHWTDFLILYQEYGPEIIDAVLGDDTVNLARRKYMLRKLLELIEAECK